MRRTTTSRVFKLALILSTFIGGTASEAVAQIEEIVVTTRKRAENLQEVPIVITAFTAESIERKGIADLNDIAKYTSGVMLDQGFSRQDTRVVIRGLSPTRGRQNVAILQDEVDITSLAQSSAGGSFVINPRLQDVERIEVVKGPHPALFGRSAFSGAINYISKKPGNDFEGNAQIDVGTREKAEARVSMSGPVVEDKLAVGVNGSVWGFGGYYNSSVTGADVGGGDGWGVAVSAKFTPNETLTFNSRTEYSKDSFDPDPRFAKSATTLIPLPSQVTTPVNGFAVIAGTANNTPFPQATGSLGNASDYPNAPSPSRNPRTGTDYPGSDRKIFRTTLRIDLEGETVNFSSISHYGNNDTFQFNDTHQFGDFASPAVSGAQETNIDTGIKLISQELRLQSTGDGSFSWTLGGVFWDEQLEQANRNLVCASTAGGCFAILGASPANYIGAAGEALPNLIKRHTHHVSGYGLGSYAFTDRLKFEVELRYTVEKEDTSGFVTTSPTFLGCPSVNGLPLRNAAGACVGTAAQVTGPLRVATYTGDTIPGLNVGSVFWVPRFTLDYKATDEALLYVTAGMGKKPGGLSTVQNPLGALANNIYDPEEMWVYEVGAKTEWLDGRLQLNGALYYQDYSKKQVSVTQTTPQPPFTGTRVVNAAKAEVKGLELDAVIAPSDDVTLRASYTYNDGEYKSFTDLSNSASAISRAAFVDPVRACTVTTITVAAGANPQRCIVDYSGRRLEGAPKHSLQMGASVGGEISADLGWFIDTDVRFQTKRFTSFENSLSMDSYWLVDLRAGIKTEKWSMTAYVNNLFNDDTIKASAVYLQDWNASFRPPNNGILSFGSGILPDKRLFGVRASMNF